MTKTQTIINLLLANGYYEVTAQHKTRKYRVFARTGYDRFIYVGKAAGVRKGQTVGSSVSMDADRVIAALSKGVFNA